MQEAIIIVAARTPVQTACATVVVVAALDGETTQSHWLAVRQLNEAANRAKPVLSILYKGQINNIIGTATAITMISSNSPMRQ